MTLRRRLLLFYSLTLSFSLIIVGCLSWYEFSEQRTAAMDGGAEAAQKESPLEETVEILLFGGLPAIVLGILAGGLLMRRALRPIEELTVVLEKTTANNLSDPVARSGNGDEIDRMTAVFNQMKERLGISFTQAREFTQNASHELKTPLTIIRSNLEQMHIDGETPPDHRERICSMLEEVQRLTGIVNHLTFLAKVDSGSLAIAVEQIALSDLVNDLLEDTTILAANKDISVILSPCEAVTIMADRMRIRQALLNLADNAVKYSTPGGTIRMELRHGKSEAVFAILNSGAPVPPELRERVFERFFRGDPAHNGMIEGSGLGLSIAKSVVEAHNGTIRYEVLADGLTQVTVTLPCGKPS